MTCARCDEMAERVAFLEAELGLRITAGEIEAVRVGFGLRPGAVHLVLALYAAKGAVVSVPQLEDAVPPKDHARERVAKIIDVYVCGVRKVAGKDFIRTAWAQGYYLPPESMAKVEGVLATHAAMRSALRAGATA